MKVLKYKPDQSQQSGTCVCLAIARQMDPMDQRHVALLTPYIYIYIYIYIYPGCLKYTLHISKTHCGKSITIIKQKTLRVWKKRPLR